MGDQDMSQPDGRMEVMMTIAAPSQSNEANTSSPTMGEDSMQKLGNKTNGQSSSIPMGECGHLDHHSLVEEAGKVHTLQKVSILPLVFLIYHEVSGGAFGAEECVQAAGPLLTIIGFLVFPFIWSIPEALITAEMGTMFPENGGYVVWVSSALGPYWGFQLGWMKWLSGVIDSALYPVLFLDYLKSVIPALGGGLPRTFAALGLTGALTYMNYRGLNIVGLFAVFLGVFSILPFIVMGLVATPRLRPKRWLVVDLHNVDWNLYLNTLFWNLNYWDSISTLAGEVDNPSKSLPKALFYAAILIILSYLYPLLIGTGAIPLDRKLWTDGYFSDIAKIIGGVWLTWWMQGAAAASNMGMFIAKMSSYSYQLLGMAELGMLPKFFSMRSRYGTPLIGIMFSASGVLLLSWLSFQEIIAAENILYCFGMLLEFLAFMRLRIKCPMAPRPYKIPLGTIGSILIIIPPTLVIFVELAFASLKIMIISFVAVIIGLILRPCLKYLEKKRWLRFSIITDIPDLRATENENAVESLID
ncbi:probable polyamine transporter At1g31830 isoform X2 [Elaeis guineensis]|uniref:Polyamine transporter PUT1 n=1 Tax=Elaeis guineensis var. tenera TaxID=51953 RepID=A0A6J0PHI3_ELAGV|nr:probable polyamine transporter At1g31830 isoform X2 [Elaeis guineensis]